jgi:hypothetical protein
MPKTQHRRLQQDAFRSGNSLNTEIIDQLDDRENAVAHAKRLSADLDRLQAQIGQQATAIRQLAETQATMEAMRDEAMGRLMNMLADRIGEIVKTSVESTLLGAAKEARGPDARRKSALAEQVAALAKETPKLSMPSRSEKVSRGSSTDMPATPPAELAVPLSPPAKK